MFSDFMSLSADNNTDYSGSLERQPSRRGWELSSWCSGVWGWGVGVWDVGSGVWGLGFGIVGPGFSCFGVGGYISILVSHFTQAGRQWYISRTRARRIADSDAHLGVELRANLKSISHRCHLFEVAFVC